MEANFWIILLLGVGLCIAVLSDLKTHRIPNWLVVAVILSGLLAQTFFYEWIGLSSAVLGILVGFLCFLPLHVFGALGAGDVKLLAAVGSVLGPKGILIAALATVAAGGVIALVFIGFKGGLGDLWARYSRMAILLAYGKPIYLPPSAGEAANLRFPYALAIACGTVFSILYL